MKKFLGIVVLGLLWCNTVQALPECLGEHYNQWTNCQGTFTYSDGEKYTGGWKDSNPHGHGTYTYSSGNIYTGEWRDGRYHGQGTATWEDGTVVKGIWENGELVEAN